MYFLEDFYERARRYHYRNRRDGNRRGECERTLGAFATLPIGAAKAQRANSSDYT